ncbi:serine/threonine-protein kinase [Archangium gephyra]|uniref:non-specific serine/threonine protein kinase n=1 Tax=Archangium gephyra TaxID=48 RepID=A0AAC8TFR0_9BACT|nr:serine/threonine-protein kinase [Archangium gephyra]AKJ04347.1 serine/threonine protein kinase [Archangium gephyra]REG37574.1 serine/threonine-protein kinase [Archangium gephyra]
MASPCPHCGSTDGSDHLCSASQMALIGQVLDGRYKIEDVLGQGGMGMVFSATQTSVQRPVAVKTLNPSLAAAPQFFERFRREAEIASRLRHPNVITIYDFGRAQDGTCYYVMELLEGESLRELVKRDGPMSLRRAVDVIEQACRGLAHAHEQGAVHRDIKPHNIMVQQLDKRDFVKVLDFGLVKALEAEDEHQLTSTGQVLGTPQYMPPEQAGGEHVDHRSDLYSMGGVFYYCLTGTSPYGANTVRKALTAALTQPVPTVAAKRLGAPVPQALEEFFAKALAREKEDRFQNAQEFIDAMLDAVADLAPEELDALPTNSVPEAGSSSKSSRAGSSSRPGQRSVSKPGRSSPSESRSRPGAPAARAGSQPSAARAAQPAARGSQPSSAAPARVGSGSSSAARPRPPRPEAAAPAPAPHHTHSLTEDVPRGSLGKKLALVAVPLLLIAAGGAVVVMRPAAPAEPPPSPLAEAKQAPTPAAPAVDSMLLVRIRSTPEGATVFAGDVQIGTAPLERRLRRDEVHELTFQLAGHQDVKRKLDFNGVVSDAETVSVTLEPVKAEPVAEPSRPSRPAKQGKDKEKDDSVPIFE